MNSRSPLLQATPRAAGFTLIEMMIVVAIIGLLAALAYPAYNWAVLKGKRSEGRTAIADLVQQQERYLTQTGSYGFNSVVFNAGTINLPFKTFSGNSLASAAYLLGVRQCTFTPQPALTDCGEVFADPQPAGADPAAGTLWMRSTGEKGCSGTNPSVCWK